MTRSNTDALRASHPELDSWLWALVKVDPAKLDNTLERVESACCAGYCTALTPALEATVKHARGL